jgi:hypothetical protein
MVKINDKLIENIEIIEHYLKKKKIDHSKIFSSKLDK